MYIYRRRHFCRHHFRSVYRKTRFTSKMRSSRVLLMAFGLILFVMVQADMNSLEKRAGKRYCGETLNNVLMLICDSVYKRSDSTEMDVMNWPPSESMANPFVYGERSYFPFKTRDSAVSLIPRQYKRRGVADECCSKPCTLAELSTYCGVKTR